VNITKVYLLSRKNSKKKKTSNKQQKLLDPKLGHSDCNSSLKSDLLKLCSRASTG
jgi:hypothetical protein